MDMVRYSIPQFEVIGKKAFNVVESPAEIRLIPLVPGEYEFVLDKLDGRWSAVRR